MEKIDKELRQLWRIPSLAAALVACVIIGKYLISGEMPQSGESVTIISGASFWGLPKFIPLTEVTRLWDIAGVYVIVSILTFVYQETQKRDLLYNLIVPLAIIILLGNHGDLAIGTIIVASITAILSFIGAAIGRKKPLMPLIASIGGGLGVSILGGIEGGMFSGILTGVAATAFIALVSYTALLIGILINFIFGNFSGVISWLKGE